MAICDLSITYDIEPPVFFPATAVAGKVIFLATEDLPFDSVQVECVGTASTKRTKLTSSSSGFAKNVTYSATDTFLEHTKVLLEHSGEDEEEKQIETHTEGNRRRSLAFYPPSKSVITSGRYSLPFTFFLPLNCPSSFEGSYGRIRYYCRVMILCNGAVCYSRKEAFTVIGWADLNEYPLASHIHQTEAHSCGQKKGGKTMIRLCLRQQGYVPGEMINARIEVVNEADKPVSAITAQFVQRANYAAKKQESEEWNKWEERRVLQQETRKEKIASNKTSIFHWEAFPVPACCPSMIIESKILRVQYELHVHLLFDSTMPPVVVVLPIIIGAVPLKYSFEELQPARLQPADGPAELIPYLPLMERHPDMPLPLYTLQSDDAVDIRDPSDFAFMPEPIEFSPYTVMYQSSKRQQPVKKRFSRRENQKEKKGITRSRSSSRFSFLGSTKNLTVSTLTLNDSAMEPTSGLNDEEKENETEKIAKKGSQKGKVSKKEDGKGKVTKKEHEKGSALKRWRKKATSSEDLKAAKSDEEKEETTKVGMQKEDLKSSGDEKDEGRKDKENEEKNSKKASEKKGTFRRWRRKTTSFEDPPEPTKNENEDANKTPDRPKSGVASRIWKKKTTSSEGLESGQPEAESVKKEETLKVKKFVKKSKKEPVTTSARDKATQMPPAEHDQEKDAQEMRENGQEDDGEEATQSGQEGD